MTQPEVEALLAGAPSVLPRILMLVQWRAGLRVSGPLVLETRDVALRGERPTLTIREGKGERAKAASFHLFLEDHTRGSSRLWRFDRLPAGPGSPWAGQENGRGPPMIDPSRLTRCNTRPPGTGLPAGCPSTGSASASARRLFGRPEGGGQMALPVGN